MISKTTIIVASIIIYMVLATTCCKAVAAGFYLAMASMYGRDNVQIAGCAVQGKEYGHAYLIVNGKPYDPRFLGLLLMSRIDYANPIQTWNNVEDFRREYSLIPFK